MLKALADNRVRDSLAGRMRRKRFEFFLDLLSRLERPLNLLDVGGTESFWKVVDLPSEAGVQVTLVNLVPGKVTLPGLASVAGDACCLDFGDDSFDVVFSNSVI